LDATLNVTPNIGAVEQVQADEKEDRGHEVVAVGADVAQHASGRGGNGPDGRDGDEDADGKERRNGKGPPGGHPALFVDEAYNQRNAGQMTGTQQNAQNAPEKRGRQRYRRRGLHGFGQRYEIYPATPISASFLSISSCGKKPTWRKTSFPSLSKKTWTGIV